jgi:multidrug resistance efflux pump
MNPLAKIDDKSDIPPKAQMMIAQAQQQVKQMQQQMQAMQLDMKYKGSLEQFKQGEETKRELMRQHTKAHDTEMHTETMAQDTIVKTESQKEIEQMKANIALILAHINAGQEKLANAEATERAI